MKPIVETYSITEVKICGDCKATGVVWKPGLKTHGEDYGKSVECSVCQGTGMVDVKVDTTVTITPHYPKCFKNIPPNT